MLNSKDSYEIKLVCHAFNVLEQFLDGSKELGVTDVCKRTKLTKNKAFRLLATLQSLKYIDQDKVNGTYRLGFKVNQLSQTECGSLGNFKELRRIMKDLSIECGETICYSILNGYETIVSEVVQGNQRLQAIKCVGSRFPAHTTAAGKVLTAFLPPEAFDRYLAQHDFLPKTPYTITDAKIMRQHLQEVVQQGYALEKEEHELGLFSIGVPVRDVFGKVIGAVTVPGPIFRYTSSRVEGHIIPSLLGTAAEISRTFGFPEKIQFPCAT